MAWPSVSFSGNGRVCALQAAHDALHALCSIHGVEVDAGHAGVAQFASLLCGPLHAQRLHVVVVVAVLKLLHQFGGEVYVKRLGQQTLVAERGERL